MYRCHDWVWIKNVNFHSCRWACFITRDTLWRNHIILCHVSILVRCAVLIPFPPYRETGRLHLWPTWFDFVKCVPSPLARPDLLLISFIMFRSLNERRIVRETSVTVTGGGAVGVSGQNQVYHSRLSGRDCFIIPGISMCDCKSTVSGFFSLSPFSSHSISFSLCFCLALSSACACPTKSLGSLASISMNQSLLSSHMKL